MGQEGCSDAEDWEDSDDDTVSVDGEDVFTEDELSDEESAAIDALEVPVVPVEDEKSLPAKSPKLSRL